MSIKERIHGEGKPSHAVIWLHGLGASADDFYPVLPYLNLEASPCIRFIFPQAPDRHITINGGYVMPGWYDIKGSEITDKEDLIGMSESQQTLESLIRVEIERGIPSENIVLAGFSQGGAVAYYTALRSQHKVAGVLALSTYLPFASRLEQEHSAINIQTPIMSMHGLQDDVVPLATGKLAPEQLMALGYQVVWKEYAMQHNVIPEQLQDIGFWFNQLFAG
ncbi:alpha/beta hydrolase [Agaribacterium sp. ZY112]|uniref:alpha/beta hydrolase n=1 Tax=Agaribacterium sp. ZY112 TaxID=3233574 RepID=UPI003523AC91